MTYIQNTHHIRGFKLTFADWLKFRLIEELTYEIDVRGSAVKRRFVRISPPFTCYINLATRNTADVPVKPMAVCLRCELILYTTCLVHILSRNLSMLKSAYKSSVEVRN
jgi:hypothetical protein